MLAIQLRSALFAAMVMIVTGGTVEAQVCWTCEAQWDLETGEQSLGCSNNSGGNATCEVECSGANCRCDDRGACGLATLETRSLSPDGTPVPSGHAARLIADARVRAASTKAKGVRDCDGVIIQHVDMDGGYTGGVIRVVS